MNVKKPTSTKKQVILVNDSPTQGRHIAAILVEDGYNVETFLCPRAALKYMRDKPLPSLIITDLYMPGIDGWRFSRLLRSPEYKQFNAVPILVTSHTVAVLPDDSIFPAFQPISFIAMPKPAKVFLETVTRFLSTDSVRDPLRVLGVDDSAVSQTVLRATFPEPNFKIEIAENGERALSLLKETQPHIIVLDYHLPDMTGLQLLEKCRTLYPDAVVIMITSNPDANLAADMLAKGAHAYVKKPLDPAYLELLARKTLREHRMVSATREIQRHRDALEKSQKRFSLLFNRLQDALLVLEVITDEDGEPCDLELLELNPAAKKMSQGKGVIEIHKTIRGIIFDPDPYWIETLGRVALTGATNRFTRYSPWFDKELQVLAYSPQKNQVACLVRDVTHEKKLEQSLRQSKKMSAVGRLAGGVAHEFNNLLQVINGYTNMALEMLSEGSSPREELGEVLKAGNRSADLVKKLLSFSRKDTINAEYIDVNAVIKGFEGILRPIISENIDFELQFGDIDKTIHIDVKQFETILINLCSNAKDAIKDGNGKIILKTELQDVSEAECVSSPGSMPGKYVKISLSDTGEGIEPDKLDLIFEPFYTSRADGEGTGLGLATVFGLVRNNAGMLKTESNPGEGTRFDIYLPAHDADISLKQANAEIGVDLSGNGKTILIAEDEPMVLSWLKGTLEKVDYSVLTAQDGEVAQRVFNENRDKIDLVMTDVIMPKMGGQQLYQHIRTSGAKLPVLFASGYDRDDKFDQIIASDKRALLLKKPFTTVELQQAVFKMLDRVKQSV